jgi:hypothetical protein
MDINQLINEISTVDVDVKKFVSMVIEDMPTREDVVRLVLTHPHIMIYYHCYYILDQASFERPDLFYNYWDDFAQLLDHKNSYHRDIGMTLLANLTQVDDQSRFEAIFDRFFAHLHDAKFLTAVNCVQNSQKVMRYKPDLMDRILPLLLNTDNLTDYPLKQKELMKSFILPIIDEHFDRLNKTKGVLEFIRSCTTSTSPKTKKMASAMLKKRGSSPLT